MSSLKNIHFLYRERCINMNLFSCLVQQQSKEFKIYELHFNIVNAKRN